MNDNQNMGRYPLITANNVDYWKQRKREEEAYQDNRELVRENARAEIREASKARTQERSLIIREEAEERKRGQYESLSVNHEGKVIIETKSSQMKFEPRNLTNMRFPQIFVAARASCPDDCVFVLDTIVAESRIYVFLDPKKVSSGNYLLGKLATSGIDIFAPSARAKDYARKILAHLMQDRNRQLIPDEPGWTEWENGKYVFVEEEDLTWQKILKLL